MSEPNFDSFDDFWPYYLNEHSDPTNRALHALGTMGAVGLVGAGIASRNWKLAALAPLVGYGAAWVGHFFVEKNKPATFKHPFWSIRGDLKMSSMFLTGQLDEELERYGIEDERQPLLR